MLVGHCDLLFGAFAAGWFPAPVNVITGSSPAQGRDPPAQDDPVITCRTVPEQAARSSLGWQVNARP
jgi:hypothetical protein